MGTYINGIFVKESKYGLKISIKVDDFAKEVKQYQKGGMLKMEVAKRKEATATGLTHYVKLDDFEPTKKVIDSKVENPKAEEKLDDLPF